jgi:hypothetical protein
MISLDTLGIMTSSPVIVLTDYIEGSASVVKDMPGSVTSYNSTTGSVMECSGTNMGYSQEKERIRLIVGLEDLFPGRSRGAPFTSSHLLLLMTVSSTKKILSDH